MIKSFIAKFDNARTETIRKLMEGEAQNYKSLFKMLCEILHDADEYEDVPDPKRIEYIDHGDYQGTLVFVVAAAGYQPRTYWCTRVYYGSCSSCDTLQAINENVYDWETEKSVITEEIAKQYLTLMLHMLQNMRSMFDEE